MERMNTPKQIAKVEEKKSSDYECPICMEICAEPVLTPCRHFFCLQCQKTVSSMGMACPLCRAHFERNFVPIVDTSLQQEIMNNARVEFEKRKQELMQLGLWRGSKKPIKFSFGNTHELVIDPQPSRANARLKNIHRWAMFITLNDLSNTDSSHKITGKFIKSVTYYLHPTFRPSTIKVTRAPFLLSRLGWGYFDVVMAVEFQPWTQLGTRSLSHELCFDDRGKTNTCIFEIGVENADPDTITLEELGRVVED